MSFNQHDVQSPNEMMVDADEYVSVTDESEKESIAIISPDTLDSEADQLQDLPLATDHDAMRELILPPLAEEPKVLEDVVNTWSIQSWRSLNKREQGPVFQAGSYPWRVLLFPYGNNVDQCSIYLEHGFEKPADIPENWSCCVQFALVLSNPNDPRLYIHHVAHHRFTKEEADWGFTRFYELRKMFNVPFEGATRPLCENDMATITAYVRVVEDETGVLWHNFTNYDSKKETGYVGLKNQGATCYLNSLLQSLYFTNAFRKAIYGIPTEHEDSLSNSAYTLQRLFYQLQTSDAAVGTNELTKSFGWETRHIFEQQDVQELSRKLMERMEEKMKGTPAERVLPEMFSGKIKTYISCVNVDYESSRIEDFWDIQLNVSGNKNLLESFEDYIQVEKMEGENQYYAGDEHKLQDANKGVIFTSFPDVLHLQLKRFEYDIQRDMMMKINDRYEFPEVFDAAPYLSEDADRSVSWTYQLHGVLVHSGDLNAGHYYAFLKPNKDGWFYRYDDDKVTRATMREVLEENFGGEFRTANGAYLRAPLQKKAPAMRQNSAYMLVYIRQSRLDKILCPVTEDDIPRHLRSKVEEESALREARRKEREEQHLYIGVKVITEETFRHHGGTDLAVFDAGPQSEDAAAPRFYRVLRSMSMEQLVEIVAKDLNQAPQNVRFWVMVNRQNKTVRPDQPIMDLSPTVEETFQRASAHRDQILRLWAEVAEETTAEGNAIWPTHEPHDNGIVVKNDLILVFLKHFDVEAQTLRGVSHVYISREKKVEELVPLIMKKMGWGDKLPAEDKIFLFEEIKPSMIEVLKPKQTLKGAELQDGDIICFQRSVDRKTDRNYLEKRLGLNEKQSTEDLTKKSDRCEDARDYYDFLHNKKTVKFHPHPTRTNNEKFPPFELDLNSKITYDVLAERVAEYIGWQPTHLRFWTVNASTGNPRTPVKRGPNQTLQSILNPTGFNHLSTTQRSDAFYFEVLEMSLAELDTKKSVKISWLSEGITKEEPYDILVPKNGNIEDLIQALVNKAEIPDEAEDGRIRVYESSQNKFYRELSREYPVISLNEYTGLFAERVPEEELKADEGHFIPVFHFQNEPQRTHGIPFKFLLIEGEKFSDTKKRLEKRTGLKGKSFEKIKIAVVRRSQFSKAQYLNDDDVLWDVATDDDSLGLDHVDRTRTMRNGAGDMFLR
ncbi:ubiquitin carboxyl-terminal hydrolase [Sodiomyces alkalinus F11]|uniref:ubiquitinyl hydrolase 1 n=1 Tax=Sodiomyces alkalinus (strain CBS 110278 / VKM F-3762 / F11) TaxID=1314773 RepID=A0A3N2Q8V5_SODAK|nr:ubiquitin carboxyl-terminal hydrolase [Sodiomyces alkalinus F11]ROT43204.1 ubiquitin carboxyl-terminal hydrolase [Sodiomyces alkalinus F11]